MEKLKELLRKQKEISNEIFNLKNKMCSDKLELLGLTIGDKVELLKESRSRQGFIKSIKLNTDFNPRFELELLAVKKDGTPSKNRLYMYSDIENYTKVN